MALCRRHPGLIATVLDLGPSAAIGREIVAAEGMAGRVVHREGDARTADLGIGLDVVSAFNFLQHFPADQARDLLVRARAALRPGGRLVVGETERPAPGDPTHRMASLTGLLFFLMTGTRTYSREELRGLLDAAGFGGVRRHPNPRSPWRVVYVAEPG
jgi:SAM-dependent methyltransferase